VNHQVTAHAPAADHGWDGLLRGEWLRDLRSTSFLTKCREGVASPAELRLFVVQQYQYSRHFVRYLCALLANLPDERDRGALMRNLFDEMGLGGGGNVPHAQIYRDMMAAMSLRDESGEILPGTRALVDTMFDCCKDPRPMVGLGALCLGAEAIVPDMYSTIVRGFEAVGVPREQLEFFHLHIVGDDEHALTMREIILRELSRDPQSRVELEDGAARAIGARVSFFDDITRRASAVRINHDRGDDRAV